MSDRQQETTAVVPVATPSDVSRSETSESSAEPARHPTLASYFNEDGIAASKFLIAVKSANINRFDEDDITKAADLMGRNDPYGERLWQLLCQPKLPASINSWIWKAIGQRLAFLLGIRSEAADSQSEIREALSRQIVRLPTDPKKKSQRPAFWVRIAANYLLRVSGVSPLEILDLLGNVTLGDSGRATQSTALAIQYGSNKEINLAADVAALSRRELVEAQRKEHKALAETAALKTALDAEASRNADLSARVGELGEESARLGTELAQLNTTLESARQNWGYDLSELKASQRRLFQDQINPLLSDAIDALELESPALQIAVERIKMTVSLIQGASR
jgi:hypothetical protein